MSLETAPPTPALDPKSYAVLAPGDVAPWFRQRCNGNPQYAFDTAAGRWILLCFIGSAADANSRAALDFVRQNRAAFNDVQLSFFGVTMDPRDGETLQDQIPGIRYVLDFDGSVGKLYGALPRTWTKGNVAVRQFWMLLDPALRVHAVVPFQPEGGDRTAILSLLQNLPAPERTAGIEAPAPILILPNVFDADFRARLIEEYNKHGGQDSGFMRDQGGKTVMMVDHSHKRRRDHVLGDEKLIRYAKALVERRIAPQIQRVHNFRVTRMERHIVACYRADEQAHFRPHRDNTTKGTAHRRFAVTINLNDEFEGGEISFPEYGARSYKPPPGAALVFSCGLLHAVSVVSKGARYAYLPFLYDEAAARVREENNQHLDPAVGQYYSNGKAKT